MTTACPRAPREKKKKNSNNKLILTAKTRRNEYTKCIYFGLKRFSNRIHPLG